MTTPDDPRDRRKLRRLPAADLRAEVRVKAGLLSTRWIEVDPVDYTRKGIAVQSNDVNFSNDDRVLMRVVLKLDMGDIVVDKIEGAVRNMQVSGRTRRFGVEFDYEANRHMKSLDTRSKLGRIEGILDRSDQLRQRIGEQQRMAMEEAEGYPAD